MKPERRKTRGVLIASLVILFVGVVAGGYWLLTHREPAASSGQGNIAQQNPPAAIPTALTSKMLVMGDVYWGRYINDWSMASPLKYAYPFSRLNEFERDKYDAWIADMECPITNNPKLTSAQEDNYLTFDCSPAYLPEAKKWFTAFTLANNHTDNQKPAGYTETQQHLDENGIQYFGSYEPEDYGNVCNVLSIPTRITMSDKTTKQGKLPMVWCGYHGVFKTPSAQSIAVMNQYKDLFNVVAMPHSGTEYKPAPDEIKTNLYRSLVDGGADVVLGNHAHWVQTTEAYKGKLIVYNMGNFIFDQQFSLEVTRGAAIQMTVSVEAKDAKDLDKWLALGESCSSYTDTCLQKAKEQSLTKLPLQYHFSVAGSRDDGKLVHKATEAELASIKDRMKWATTIKGLSGVNSGE